MPLLLARKELRLQPLLLATGTITSLVLLVAIFTTDASAQRCFRKTRPRGGEATSCDVSNRYRLISGRCNNLDHPEWGSAGSTFLRLLPNQYDNGRDIPRGGHHPSSLPSSRWISQKNHPDNDVPDTRFTHMVMQFGQFLDHDLTLTPKDEATDCCSNRGVQDSDCFTISIPSPDRFYSWVNNTAKCLNMIRSTPVCRLNTREQYNELTAFVDASNVYGSDNEHAALLRTYSDGKLQRNSNTDQLPSREQLNVRPNTRLLRPEKTEDFMAGDMRVNEQPFIGTLHIVFLREHNRIAKLLREYLPEHLRTDEILYQEARRLVSAEMQNIVYGEYLPTILGVDFMRRYDLIVKEDTEYDPKVDPTIFNSFATAAFRFGHSMINGMFKLVSQRRNQGKRSDKDVYWLWRLREVFDGQSVRGAKLPLENMLEGLITQEPQTCDTFFTTEITDHLFQKNALRQNFGEDLLSLNLQRGRDHGLPGYNAYRKTCGLREISGWGEKPTEIDDKVWKKLKDAYETVNDIDLYIGGVAEKSVRGGVVGPTFACLIGEQFNRLKKGDRFFYTHTSRNGGRGLGPVAKREILQRTLGDVMCEVSTLDLVQKWVTLQPNSEYNDYETCLSKKRIAMREIAEEIAFELGPKGKQQSGSGRARESTVRRLLVNAGPAATNSLLLQAGNRPIQFRAAAAAAATDVDALAASRPRDGGDGGRHRGEEEEDANRVPPSSSSSSFDFGFPAIATGIRARGDSVVPIINALNRINNSQRNKNPITRRPQQQQQQQQQRPRQNTNLNKRPDLSIKQSLRNRSNASPPPPSLRNRLSSGNIGITSSSAACLFNLC